MAALANVSARHIVSMLSGTPMRPSFNAFFFMALSGLSVPGASLAQTAEAVDPQQVRELIEQNRRLQGEVDAQQKTIDQLQARITAVDQTDAQHGQELQSLRDQIGGSAAAEAKPAAPSDETIRLSGEMGFAFFDSGSDGPYANGEFRVDDAKVFLDASIWKNVYLHTEMDLFTREAPDENFHLGEIYAQVENLSGLWGQDGLLTLRAGRMYIPFGEEYQVRGIMDDPLVSHSVSDLWGMDEGVELYGRLAKFSYFAAVQDGGIDTLRNFHSDKSVAGRLACDPVDWLHVSASAMGTGHLNVSGDQISALWFANGFFRAVGPAATTSGFWADLAEADASVHWSGGQVKAAGGLVQVEDNNPSRDDTRHLSYFSVEAVQSIADRLYGAVRFSGVRAPGGYFLTGQATEAEYLFGNVLTTDLERLSVGLGYRFADPVVLKAEVSPEWGRTIGDGDRNEENLYSTELGVRF